MPSPYSIYIATKVNKQGSELSRLVLRARFACFKLPDGSSPGARHRQPSFTWLLSVTNIYKFLATLPYCLPYFSFLCFDSFDAFAILISLDSFAITESRKS